MPSAIQRIRQAFRNNLCKFSMHALEEMDADGLMEADVEEAAINGEVVAALTEDPRGRRFVVRGLGLNQGTQVEMVHRRQLCV